MTIYHKFFSQTAELWQFGRYLDSIEDEQKRECMRLAGEHWKPAEIAKELGWPAEKVHRTVCREKKKLEKE